MSDAHGAMTAPPASPSPNELRSQLYAWLGDCTSQPDGDTWTHEQLMPAARDLADLISRTLQGDDRD